MKELRRKPHFWLTTKISKTIFEKFNQLIQFNEPIPPFNTRYKGKLEGILNSVSQTYHEEHLNETVLDAAAAYFNQLIRGHPFKNGNKRIAILLTHFFLLNHGIDFTLTYKGMYNFALSLAKYSEELKAEQTKQVAKEIINTYTEKIKERN
jgi:death-on-curing protein